MRDKFVAFSEPFYTQDVGEYSYHPSISFHLAKEICGQAKARLHNTSPLFKSS